MKKIDYNKAFLLYKTDKIFLDNLSDIQVASLFRAIFDFQIDGIVPNLDEKTQMVFLHFKSYFDINTEKYNEKVENSYSKAGKISGFKRGKQYKSYLTHFNDVKNVNNRLTMLTNVKNVKNVNNDFNEINDVKNVKKNEQTLNGIFVSNEKLTDINIDIDKDKDIDIDKDKNIINKKDKNLLNQSIKNLSNSLKINKSKGEPLPTQKYLVLHTLEELKEWWEWWGSNDDPDMELFMKLNNINQSLVDKKFNDLINHCEIKNKTYPNYRVALKQFIINEKTQNWGNNTL